MIERSNMAMNYLKYLGGNLVATSSAVLQTVNSGEGFRTWSSWAIAVLVGVLTIVKLSKDIWGRK